MPVPETKSDILFEDIYPQNLWDNYNLNKSTNLIASFGRVLRRMRYAQRLYSNCSSNVEPIGSADWLGIRPHLSARDTQALDGVSHLAQLCMYSYSDPRSRFFGDSEFHPASRTDQNYPVEDNNNEQVISPHLEEEENTT
ncbi:hypothetical protein N7478_003070 [Penicillium angulare]|uniref:uncharacterized protein n=1 Tax=Penicillium angulare TaxID=116970 RepID=UPI002541E264|nr:uncharacterized protein N7478_003070 [Penicillium angulare]KAJ5287384.1 hypothetical protein N7478_003070 [Penicillium angulare]